MAQPFPTDQPSFPSRARSRLGAALCLFAALLVAQWGAPGLDRTSYGEISSILNGVGTIGADENVRPASVQPPGLLRTIASEARHHGQQREFAAAQAGAWALTPASPAIPASRPAAAPRPAANAPAVIAATAFQQRAPPSTT